MRMPSLLGKFLKDEGGQGSAEYLFVIAVIALVALVGIQGAVSRIITAFQLVSGKVATAVGS